MRNPLCQFFTLTLCTISFFLPAAAQEAVVTSQTLEFVAHPTHCAQLIGGKQYQSDSLTAEMSSKLTAAMASLVGLNPRESLAAITELCRNRIVGK